MLHVAVIGCDILCSVVPCYIVRLFVLSANSYLVYHSFVCVCTRVFKRTFHESAYQTTVVPHTFTGCRRDPNADEVLEGEHAGQEAAVLGPDLRDGFPPAPVHDRYQSEGVKHGIEVHTLPDHIDHQHEARLWEAATKGEKEYERKAFSILIFIDLSTATAEL